MGMESFGGGKVDDNKKAEEIAKKEQELKELKERYGRAIKSSLDGEPEFDIKKKEGTHVTVEDGDEVATAVFEAREKAKNMSQRELEVEAYKLSQVLMKYDDVLREKYKFKR